MDQPHNAFAASLTLRARSGRVVSMPLRPQAAPLSLGRAPRADIVLFHDPAVSAVHAELVCIAGSGSSSDLWRIPTRLFVLRTAEDSRNPTPPIQGQIKVSAKPSLPQKRCVHPEVFVRELLPEEGPRLKSISKAAGVAQDRARRVAAWFRSPGPA